MSNIKKFTCNNKILDQKNPLLSELCINSRNADNNNYKQFSDMGKCIDYCQKQFFSVWKNDDNLLRYILQPNYNYVIDSFTKNKLNKYIYRGCILDFDRTKKHKSSLINIPFIDITQILTFFKVSEYQNKDIYVLNGYIIFSTVHNYIKEDSLEDVSKDNTPYSDFIRQIDYTLLHIFHSKESTTKTLIIPLALRDMNVNVSFSDFITFNIDDFITKFYPEEKWESDEDTKYDSSYNLFKSDLINTISNDVRLDNDNYDIHDSLGHANLVEIIFKSSFKDDEMVIDVDIRVYDNEMLMEDWYTESDIENDISHYNNNIIKKHIGYIVSTQLSKLQYKFPKLPKINSLNIRYDNDFNNILNYNIGFLNDYMIDENGDYFGSGYCDTYCSLLVYLYINNYKHKNLIDIANDIVNIQNIILPEEKKKLITLTTREYPYLYDQYYHTNLTLLLLLNTFAINVNAIYKYNVENTFDIKLEPIDHEYEIGKNKFKIESRRSFTEYMNFLIYQCGIKDESILYKLKHLKKKYVKRYKNSLEKMTWLMEDYLILLLEQYL